MNKAISVLISFMMYLIAAKGIIVKGYFSVDDYFGVSVGSLNFTDPNPTSCWDCIKEISFDLPIGYIN